MPTVKWKVPQLLQGSSHGLQAAPAARSATVAEAAQPKVVASMLADRVMKSQRFDAAELRQGMGHGWSSRFCTGAAVGERRADAGRAPTAYILANVTRRHDTHSTVHLSEQG